MSNNVDITLAADAKEVERAFDRMGGVINAQKRKLDSLSQAGVKGSRQTATGFAAAGQSVKSTATQVVGSLTGITSAAGGVMLIAQSLKNEWEDLRRRQNAALDTTLDVAAKINDTRNAYAGDASLPEKQLEARIIEASKKTGAKPSSIATALQDAFSAKGDATNEQAVQAVEQAFRLNRADVEAATELSARAMDVQKFSGTDDARANLGFIQNVQQASRVTSLKMVGQSMMGQIVGLTKKGDTLEQSAELAATITQLAQDAEGRVSANALSSFGNQLENYVPQRATTGKFKGQLTGKDGFGEFAIPDSQAAAFQKAGSTTERIEVLQQMPELRRAFIGQASFENKTRAAMEMLFRGDEQAKNAMQASRGVIRGVNTPEEQAFQAQLFEEEIASKNAGKYQQVLNMQEESQARIERSRLRRTTESSAASARKIVQDTLGEIESDSWTRNIADEMKNRSGEDPFDVAINRLEFERTKAADKTKTFNMSFLASGPEALSDRGDKESVRLINETIEKLKEERRLYQERNPGGSAQQSLDNATEKARDPQMEENNSLLRQLVDQGKDTGRPQVTERKSAKLSRGAN